MNHKSAIPVLILTVIAAPMLAAPAYAGLVAAPTWAELQNNITQEITKSGGGNLTSLITANQGDGTPSQARTAKQVLKIDKTLSHYSYQLTTKDPWRTLSVTMQDKTEYRHINDFLNYYGPSNTPYGHQARAFVAKTFGNPKYVTSPTELTIKDAINYTLPSCLADGGSIACSITVTRIGENTLDLKYTFEDNTFINMIAKVNSDEALTSITYTPKPDAPQNDLASNMYTLNITYGPQTWSKPLGKTYDRGKLVETLNNLGAPVVPEEDLQWELSKLKATLDGNLHPLNGNTPIKAACFGVGKTITLDFNGKWVGGVKYTPKNYICSWRNVKTGAIIDMPISRASVKKGNPKLGTLTFTWGKAVVKN